MPQSTERIQLSLTVSHGDPSQLHYVKNSVRGEAPLGLPLPEEAKDAAQRVDSPSSALPAIASTSESKKGTSSLKQVQALHPP